jgi:endonuclease/exonuclease/phosphatase family metal-dependent hydrolase
MHDPSLEIVTRNSTKSLDWAPQIPLIRRMSMRMVLCWIWVFLTPLHANALRTVSWNIEWFPGLRPNAGVEARNAHIAAIKPELARIDPDLFLAQEITDAKAFEEILAAVPGLKLHVISDFRLDEGRGPFQQQAIASKLEAHSAWFEAFEDVESLPALRRGFAFAALKHPDGGLIMVYCLHLRSNLGSHIPERAQNIAEIRRESIRQILAHKEEMKTSRFAGEQIVGWVLGGDFNTNHDGDFPLCTVVSDVVSAGFHNSWNATPKEQRLTWRSDPDPEKRRFEPITFDYVFTKGFKPVQAKILDVPRALSDHSPVGILLEKP